MSDKVASGSRYQPKYPQDTKLPFECVFVMESDNPLRMAGFDILITTNCREKNLERSAEDDCFTFPSRNKIKMEINLNGRGLVPNPDEFNKVISSLSFLVSLVYENGKKVSPVHPNSNVDVLSGTFKGSFFQKKTDPSAPRSYVGTANFNILETSFQHKKQIQANLPKFKIQVEITYHHRAIYVFRSSPLIIKDRLPKRKETEPPEEMQPKKIRKENFETAEDERYEYLCKLVQEQQEALRKLQQQMQEIINKSESQEIEIQYLKEVIENRMFEMAVPPKSSFNNEESFQDEAEFEEQY
jgi:hypothetical protein